MLVLEAADHPGGAVRTEELTLPGFRHDTFSSVYPAAAASPVFARMPLADHGLGWVHPAACSAHPLPDGEPAVLYRDLDGDGASLDRQPPRRRRALGRVRRSVPGAFDAVRATMLSGFPPIGGPLRLLRRAGPLRLLEFARLLPESAVGLGRRLFERRRLARLAVRRGDARRRAAGRRRLRDRGVLPQPARPRRRLAEPARRRRAADGRARGLPASRSAARSARARA